MSPLLRQCIEQAEQAGAAQGHVAQCLAMESLLARVLAEGSQAIDPKQLREIAARLEEQRATCQRLALAAESDVERLLRELEHPGARLARRVLRAARAAAEAWRAPG